MPGGTIWLVLISAVLMSWRAVPLYGGGSAINADDLVARHLAAIGSAKTRATVKTRVVQGTAVYRILVGGGGRIKGTTGLVSEGRKLRFVVKFPQNDYRGETIVFDGRVIQVAFSNSNQSRSPLAYFVSTQDVIPRDGLMGGVLSTAWPLLDAVDRQPKLVYEGLKKVDGRQLHQLRYSPHKHCDLEILLYFEPDTYRHVETVYDLSVANNVGTTIVQSAKLQPERSRLEERFSDFETVDGLTLPTHWNIQFTRELPDGSTTLSQWDLKEDEIVNNVELDPRNFEAK